jgi:hypothetical protein
MIGTTRSIAVSIVPALSATLVTTFKPTHSPVAREQAIACGP